MDPTIQARARTELGLRTPKACDECRRRKVKCDGESPRCRPCTQRSLECTYRTQTRIRRKKSHREGQSGLFTANTSDNESTSEDVVGRQEPVSEQVYSSVSATQTASACAYSIELYYGPSSSFSFLQQIHRRLNALTSHHSNRNAHLRIEQGEEGLDRFNYRGLFFGRRSPGEGGNHRGNIHHNPEIHNPTYEADIMFLSIERAREFMQIYLQTNYHLIPLFPQQELESLLEDMYALPGPKTIEKSLVLVTLAIGATGTMEQASIADNLFERAKAGAHHFDDIVNVRSVQISLLMISFPPMTRLRLRLTILHAHYQLVAGRPNAAYLCVGSAVRKAFAAGLHKESAMAPGPVPKTIEERRRTYWILYVFECIVCYSFGRPLSMPYDIANTPMPEGVPLITSLVGLCKLKTRSAREIYGGPDKSLAKLWASATSIKVQLEALLPVIEPQLVDIFHMRVHGGSIGVQQMIFFSLYQHTLLLTFRPFMLFRTMISSARPNDASELATEKMKWLDEGCKICVDTARTFVTTLDFASTVNQVIKTLRLNALYLEFSAFVLVYDSLLLDPVVFTGNMPYLKTAAKSFEELELGFPLKSGSYALGQMIQILQQLQLTTRNSDNNGTPQTPTSTTGNSESYTHLTEPLEWLPAFGLDQQLQKDYDDVERVNLDFGFDMTAMDFEQFLNRDSLEGIPFME